MTWQLTKGALATMMGGGTVEAPVMQILGCKRLSLTTKYRVMISDGCHTSSWAVLASHLTEKVTSGQLSDNSVVRLNHLVATTTNHGGRGNMLILVILDLTILAKGADVGVKIGNPVPFPSAITRPTQPGGRTVIVLGRSTLQANGTMGRTMSQTMRRRIRNKLSFEGGGHVCPMARLNPCRNRWVFKTHVVTKRPKAALSNARGRKQLPKRLVDDAGKLREAAFMEQCKKFFSTIKVPTVVNSERMRSNESVAEKEKLAHGSLSEVRELLAGGAEMDWAHPHCSESALHLAVAANRISNVSYLLRVGAKVDARTQTQETPLHYAARHGRVEILWALVACGANVNAQNSEGQTPLHVCLQHKDVLKALLQAGADRTIKDKFGRIPRDLAVLNTQSYRDAVDLLE